MNSASEMMSVQDSGAQNSSTVGTLQYQRKPTFLVAENLTVTAAGKSTQVKAIVTDTALYISEPSLASQIGKPWAKVDLSTLEATPALAALGQIVQSIKSNNFVDLTGLFASVSNVRAVGTATVDGVPATEYGGSFQADALAKSLAPGLRKALAPGLQALGNSTVTFDIWVDGQGYPRKETEVEHVNGETVSIALTITAINEPLQITLPPPSQTYTQPAG